MLSHYECLVELYVRKDILVFADIFYKVEIKYN